MSSLLTQRIEWRRVAVCGVALGLVLLTTAASAQTGSVEGRVMEAGSGTPIPGANVYLSETTRGVATDLTGRFTLADVPRGTYTLVVSVIGFEKSIQTVDVDQASVDVQVRLREAELDLGEARVVSDHDREWRRQLRRFRDLFFGTTPNGQRSRFVNPEVLNFSDKGGVFTAQSDHELVYENRALGYRVTYSLDRFRSDERSTTFGGHPRYEDLVFEDPSRASRWRRARETAYNGSLKHFLQALARGTAEDEGFAGYLLENLDVPRGHLGARISAPMVTFDSLLVEVDGRPALASVDGKVLHVEYLRERQHRDGPRDWGRGQIQHSALVLLDEAVPFHPRGYFLNPYRTETHGYWAWEGRVGDRLPLDYEPEVEG